MPKIEPIMKWIDPSQSLLTKIEINSKLPGRNSVGSFISLWFYIPFWFEKIVERVEAFAKGKSQSLLVGG
jgi:hypothetical protein